MQRQESAPPGFMNMSMEPPHGLYTNDIARRLSLSGASSSEDVISSLRSMDLGDDFWMYSFKVAPCARTFNHKWTLCPCAHNGETARRRDPRLHPYRAVLCPLAKMKKPCPMGENCMWSHNVFEHWLHPARYKTRLCSFGHNCNRPICFFAHAHEELRAAPAGDPDASRGLDEREHLVNFMMHQDPRLRSISANALLQHGQFNGAAGPAGGMAPHQAAMYSHSMQSTPSMDLHTMMHMNQAMQQQMHDGSGSGGQPKPPSIQLRTQSASTPLPPDDASLDAATLLLGLQESLATLGVEGNWVHTARISDPGLSSHPHMNPIRHLDRISDSGQTLGLTSPATLADLETLIGNAMAQARARAPEPPGPTRTAPQTQLSSSSPRSSPCAAQPPASGDPLAMPAPPPPPPPPPPRPSSSAPPSPPSPVAAAARGSSEASLPVLLAQLQEQGIVTSKEQLVASLSQLLAQLILHK